MADVPEVLRAAQAYLRRGWAVVPIPAGEKGPVLKNWPQLRLPPSHLAEHFHNGCNIGLLLGDSSNGLTDVDCDAPEAIQAAPGFLPDTAMVHGRPGKPSSHYWYQTRPSPTTVKRTDLDGTMLVELRSTGGQTVVPPSVHPSGEQLTWERTGQPGLVDAASLVMAVNRVAACALLARHWPTRGRRDDCAMALAGALHRAGWSNEEITRVIRTVAEIAGDDEVAKRARQGEHTRHRMAQGIHTTGLPTLMEVIGEPVVQRLTAWLPLRHAPGGVSVPAGTTFAGDRGGLNQLAVTDAGNAEAFVTLFGERVRYDHRGTRWLLWEEHRWNPDEDGAVYRLALDVARKRLEAAASEEDDKRRGELAKWARASESKQKRDALLETAKHLLPIADAGKEWDTNPWFLGVTNGVVDLRTGALRDGRPEDKMTKRTGIAYDPEATAPRWEQFLSEVFSDQADPEAMAQFLQRAVGYSLTGSTREHVLFLLYGTGCNGKTTLIERVQKMFGDYHRKMDVGALMTGREHAIREDVARLAGARFVAAVEPSDTHRLAESLVKEMTGGDTLAARFLYQSTFEFHPTFKLWLATNHKPIIRGTDEAIWRRIRLIPFNVSFKGQEDPTLPEVLDEELPGILAWAMRGVARWLQNGLGMPTPVKTATEQYRAESDVLGQFLDEMTGQAPDSTVKASPLYQAYVRWCETNGEKALLGTAFGRRMAERGLPKQRTTSGNVYLGVTLHDTTASDV